MSAERTAEAEQTTSRSVETVACGGHCGDVVPKSDTVDVVAGVIVQHHGESVDVIGVDGGEPEIQHWCDWCAMDHFDITTSPVLRSAERVTRYVNARTVGAFVLGILISLTLASVMII